jgi:chromosome partitioning protein
MDITVAGFKGGTGKTTTAIHLAAYFSDRFGSDSTFLADGDPNKSASDWARRGELPFPVVDIMAAARVSRKYDHMIVDSQASPSKEELEVEHSEPFVTCDVPCARMNSTPVSLNVAA